MHAEQRQFCEKVREKFPQYFTGAEVVDFGSLDINGNNRYLFDEACRYTGIDLDAGPNVDWIGRGKDYSPGTRIIDTVISTEMLEHDEQWDESLRNMYRILRPEGLLVFTCATTGRPEHGTPRTSPQDAPFVGDYYRNLTEEDIRKVWDMDVLFSNYSFEVGPPADLRFWGIKRSWF